MAEPKEPQSYGSGGDWSKGDVGEEVNRLKGHPNSQHGDFYESRHDSEGSDESQGGKTSPVQSEDREHAPAERGVIAEPSRNIVATPTGAKRGGYFKRRDYE